MRFNIGDMVGLHHSHLVGYIINVGPMGRLYEVHWLNHHPKSFPTSTHRQLELKKV